MSNGKKHQSKKKYHLAIRGGYMQLNTTPAITEKEQAFTGRISKLVAAAGNAVIVTDNDAESGTTLAKMFRDIIKKLDEERTFLVKPLNDHVKTINDRFRIYSGEAKKGKALIDDKLLKFQVAKRQKREAEERKLREEREAKARAEAEKLKAANKNEEAVQVVKDAELVPVASAKLAPTRGVHGTGASSTKKVWKFDLVDFAEVPDGFKKLDETALRKAIQGGLRNCEGLKIYQKDELVVR